MYLTPKSMRLQIGLFGRTNVGKSSFLNMIAGQSRRLRADRPLHGEDSHVEPTRDNRILAKA